MSRWPSKYVIGLTGNIATGKSVVRKMLEHLGAFGLDADALAHQASAKGGPAYAQIIKLFGEWVVGEDGEINRARLGRLAFNDPEALARLMARVACEGGFTQMRKVLIHARRESKKAKVNAVVYVGDCIEEDIDELCGRAGELALLGVPMFLFQEGREPRAERAFKEIARLTRGAYCHFDAGSARQLRELLAAVAVYATGGCKALQDYGAATKSGAAVRLLEQLS